MAKSWIDEFIEQANNVDRFGRSKGGYYSSYPSWIDQFNYESNIYNRYGFKTHAGRPQPQPPLVPSEYIKKISNINLMHRQAQEGLFHVPEFHFIGPGDFPLPRGAVESSSRLAAQNTATRARQFLPRKISPGFTRMTLLKYAALSGAIWWGINRFSGHDDNYNTIQGFQEQGLSSFLRKQNTDFGSGFDRVRQLAKQMGARFEDVVSSPGFKAALSRGSFVKELGKGTFGKAELFETRYMGESLQFVKKKINLEARREVLALQEQGRLVLDRDYLAAIDLRNEASLMKPLGETSVVPSVYKSTSEELLMEYMPGRTLAKASGIPEQLRQKIYEGAAEVASKGILHQDLHLGNILYHSATGRISVLDFGLAKKSEEGFSLTARKMEEQLRKRFESHMEQFLPTALKPGIQKNRIEANTVITPVNRRENRGIAKSKRKLGSDFGSPWKGFVRGISRLFTRGSKRSTTKVLPESLQSFLKDWQGAASTRAGFQKTIGRMINESEVGEVAKKSLNTDLAQLLKGTPKKKAFVILNPKVVKETASELGLSYMGALKGVVRHERFHADVVNRGMRETIQKLNKAPFIPEHFKRLAGPHAAEEFLAHSIETSISKRMRRHPVQFGLFKGEESAYQQIEGLVESGVVAKLRSFLTDFGSGYRGLLASTSKQILKSPKRARRSLNLSSRDLRDAQVSLWTSAIRGSRGHTLRSKKNVKQLSRFGGGL